MVKYRVDGGGQVVEHAGHVRGDAVQLVQERYVLVVWRRVIVPEYGDQPLRVERGPADEERHDDGHWNPSRDRYYIKLLLFFGGIFPQRWEKTFLFCINRACDV